MACSAETEAVALITNTTDALPVQDRPIDGPNDLRADVIETPAKVQLNPPDANACIALDLTVKYPSADMEMGVVGNEGPHPLF